MHDEVLPPGSRRLLDSLREQDSGVLSDWVLAGGTGLALHLGHRRSEDFDFFRTDAVEIAGLKRRLAATAPCETLREGERDLTVLLSGVKLSFFRVPEPFIHPLHEFRSFRVADPREIGLMKLVAVSGRGSRKDFVDLYVLLRGGIALEELLRELPTRYGEGTVNTYHVLKSLTYFEDAESEPVPEMLQPFDWHDCKRFFARAAKAIVLP